MKEYGFNHEGLESSEMFRVLLGSNMLFPGIAEFLAPFCSSALEPSLKEFVNAAQPHVQ